MRLYRLTGQSLQESRPLGAVLLSGCVVRPGGLNNLGVPETSSSAQYVFALTWQATGKPDLLLAADSDDETRRWTAAMARCGQSQQAVNSHFRFRLLVETSIFGSDRHGALVNSSH